MEKRVFLPGHFSRLSALLLSLVLSVTFTASAVSSDPDEIDKAVTVIRTHAVALEENNPGIMQTVDEIETRLRAGVISPQEVCYGCHAL